MINRVFADPTFQSKKIVDVKSISVLPKSYEHFLSQSFKWCCDICEILKANERELPFCVHQFSIQMLDSYNHLGASLAKMVEEMKKSCSDFHQETKEFKCLYDWIEKKYSNQNESTRKSYFQALTQKQFFPYNLLSNIERLNDTRLPQKEEWYDPLRKQNTSEEDIAYANQVFDLFKCTNIMDYLRLYLEADIGRFNILHGNVGETII